MICRPVRLRAYVILTGTTMCIHCVGKPLHVTFENDFGLLET